MGPGEGLVYGIAGAGRAYSIRGDGIEKTFEMAENAHLHIDPAGSGRFGGVADPGWNDLLSGHV